MHTVDIINVTLPKQPPLRVKHCHTFWSKFRGLMFRRQLQPNDGILLVEASDSRVNASIHMLFMWIDLCVVWINHNQQVVDVALARRWRPMYAPKAPAQYILETHPDRLQDFRIGDQVILRHD
jgi:uncharacterized membrane protein (UPF0127 family)